MSAVEAYFHDYEKDHQTRACKRTHAVGIPLIFTALAGLGAKVVLLPLTPGLSFDLAMAVALPILLFYGWLHTGLALGVAVLLVPMYLAGSPIPAPWLWGGIAASVLLQYLGHALEGRSPAFHKNAVHMLIGPLWIAAELFRWLGLYHRAQPPVAASD